MIAGFAVPGVPAWVVHNSEAYSLSLQNMGFSVGMHLSPNAHSAAAGDFTGIGLLGQPVEIATVEFEVLGQGPETMIDIAEGGAGGMFACLFVPDCAGLTFVGSTIQIAVGPRPIIEISPAQVSFAPTATAQTHAPGKC